eukprot:7459176-Karenia_brevis.AAC.1
MFRMRAHPDVGRQAYMQRTANTISGWYGKLGQWMAHHVVLQRAHRAAWREKRVVADGITALADVRTWRPQDFWHDIRHLPHHQRHAEGWSQRSQ